MSLYSVFINIVPFIAVLTVVVFVHEMGHFLVGRWCGATVDAFSIGFGPELCHYTDRKGTRWRLAALPLGGYVKFRGDADAASTPDNAAVATMTAEERAGTMAGLSVWRRAAIVAAGPIANFILAIAILGAVFHFYGRPIVHPFIQGVFQGGAADKAGMKPGDVVLAIDGRPVEALEQVPMAVQGSDTAAIEFLVDRKGQQQTILVTPERKSVSTWLGTEQTAKIGVVTAQTKENTEIRAYPIVPAMGYGAVATWDIVRTTGHYLKGLIAGRESTEQLSGPIRIAQVSGAVAQAGFIPFIALIATLSVSIGLINLLPIPLLDGGHLMFFAYEAVRGKAMPERAQMVGFRIGLTFVAALSLFVAFNDITRIFLPKSEPAATSQSGMIPKR